VPDGDEVVDTVGLRCPLPLFHAREAMLDLPLGSTVEVLSDDPQSPSDFERWARQNGHTLLSIETHGRTYHIRVRKGPSAGPSPDVRRGAPGL
jgi:TusA-related sulfurtransferase